MIKLGITGTDTGVGKTVVSCAIAAGFRAQGRAVVAMKPVETGVRADDPARDGARLARAAGHDARMNETAPLAFPDPVAPLVAGRRVGRLTDMSILERCWRSITVGADVALVEGAGGLLVPLTETESFDGLFARWGLGLVIVAADKLGVINHTRLTVLAARAARLDLRAIVLHAAAPSARDTSSDDNAALLRELVPDVPLVQLPWAPDIGDLDGLAALAERSGLLAALDSSPTRL